MLLRAGETAEIAFRAGAFDMSILSGQSGIHSIRERAIARPGNGGANDTASAHSPAKAPSPALLRARRPRSGRGAAVVEQARRAVADVLSGRDRHRLVVVVGPCSIHDPDEALEYARRLSARAAIRAGVHCLQPIVAGLLYGVLTGWGVPVRRALLFVLGSGAGLALGRRVAPLQLLALAALPILLLEPASLFEMGAQLSFVASAGLLLALRHGLEVGPGMGGSVSKILDTSAIAIALTAPVIALHGGAAGPAGLVTNLVAIPWTGLVLLPLSLVSLALVCLPEWLVFERLLGLAAALCQWTLRGIEVAAGWVPAHEASGPPAWPFLALATALGILTLRSQPVWSRAGLALASSTLLVLAPARAVEPPPPTARGPGRRPGRRDPRGRKRSSAVLVDAGRALGGELDLGHQRGAPRAALVGSCERLDLVVASHADLDHRGGLPAVLAGMPVGALWLPPGGGNRDPAFDRACASAARAAGVPYRGAGCRKSRNSRVGDLNVEVLWPPRVAAHRVAKRGLAWSCACRSIAVMASEEHAKPSPDRGSRHRAGEGGLLASGRDIAADILKVGHHGSRGSSTPLSFLSAVGARARTGLRALSRTCRSCRVWKPSRESRARAPKSHGRVEMAP